MLRDARVDYLSWIKRAQARPARISLLESGLRTPLADLGLDPAETLTAPAPELGNPLVRGLLAARYGVSEEETFPVLGTSLGIFLVCAAAAGPGDAVLVESPAYEPFRRAPEAVGARVIPFPRIDGGDGALDPAAVLSRWEPGVRAVLVSDLHNPTGRRAGDEALAALAREAETRGALLFVDEVYRDFLPGPVTTARRLAPNIITASSLTKVYGLGGLRAGWMLGPPALIERMRNIVNLLHVVDPGPIQPFIQRGVERAESLRERARSAAAAGWAAVERWREGHADALRILRPEGGIVAWVELPAGVTGSAVAERLLAEQGVAVAPGRFFGDDTGLRFGFNLEPARLHEALDALARVVAAG